MHETAAERERRLRQIGSVSELWRIIQHHPELTNPCVEITIDYSNQRCTLGTNPLVKFNKFNFKF